MRMNSGLWCAFALACSVVACSWGGSGNGNAGNGGQPDATAAVVCGDGICAASEVGTCNQDCPPGMHGGSGSGNVGPVCGNGVCEPGESVATCPSDCNTGSGSGSGSGSSAPLNCNDSTVQTECLACLFANSCTNVNSAGCTTCLIDGLLGSGAGSGSAGNDSGCVGGAPNGTCDAGETSANCVDDCP